MTDRIIADLPTGWRGVLHDLGVTLGLVEMTPGEKAAIEEMDTEAEAGS